jgi:hypothetical protein
MQDAPRAEYGPGLVRQHPRAALIVGATQPGWITARQACKVIAGMRIDRSFQRGVRVRQSRTVERFDVKGVQELARIQREWRRDAREPGIDCFGAVGRRCQWQRHNIAHNASFSNRDATSLMAASSMRSALLLIAATDANDNNRATGPVMPSDACAATKRSLNRGDVKIRIRACVTAARNQRNQIVVAWLKRRTALRECTAGDVSHIKYSQVA